MTMAMTMLTMMMMMMNIDAGLGTDHPFFPHMLLKRPAGKTSPHGRARDRETLPLPAALLNMHPMPRHPRPTFSAVRAESHTHLRSARARWRSGEGDVRFHAHACHTFFHAQACHAHSHARAQRWGAHPRRRVGAFVHFIHLVVVGSGSGGDLSDARHRHRYAPRP